MADKYRAIPGWDLVLGIESISQGLKFSAQLTCRICDRASPFVSKRQELVSLEKERVGFESTIIPDQFRGLPQSPCTSTTGTLPVT